MPKITISTMDSAICMQVSNSSRASVISIERVLIVASRGMLRGSNDGSVMAATRRPYQGDNGEGLQRGLGNMRGSHSACDNIGEARPSRQA
jgi:hypothetical protein